MRRLFYTLLFCSLLFSCTISDDEQVPIWGMYESGLRSERSYRDPMREVDLLVKCVRPDSSILELYGFYDGNDSWKFRIMPDITGQWKYEAEFSDGSNSASGRFISIDSDKPGPLTVSDANPIWPVFRNGTQKQIRSFHVGDRFFASNFDSLQRSRFLDWVENQGYNMLSVASHYLNRRQPSRGEGWDTPKLWPLDPAEYRKLEAHLDDLETRKIIVYPFAGFFGRAADWPIDHQEQELYIRYTMARLGAYWNIILNVAGPEPLLKPLDYQNGHMTAEDIDRVAALIKKYDPYGHLLSVHNRTRNAEGEFELDPFIFKDWEDYATLQGAKSADYWEIYDFIISSRKVLKPVFAQEVLWFGNMYHGDLNLDQLRKKAITLIMAGSFINFGDMNGNSSSGFSGCLDPDSAHVEAHRIMHSVWDLFDGLPLEELGPRPDLVEGAFCLSNGRDKFLFYNPDGKPFRLPATSKLTGFWVSATDPSRKIPVDETEPATLAIPPDDGDWLLWMSN